MLRSAVVVASAAVAVAAAVAVVVVVEMLAEEGTGLHLVGQLEDSLNIRKGIHSE